MLQRSCTWPRDSQCGQARGGTDRAYPTAGARYADAVQEHLGFGAVISLHRIKDQSRRNFLRTAPAVAAAGLVLTDQALFASVPPSAESQSAAPIKPEPFQFYTAQAIEDAAHALQTEVKPVTRKGEPKNGNKDLANSRKVPFTYLLITEEKKIATEFEIQGLELDWIGLCWGGDMVWSAAGTGGCAR